MAKPSDDLEWVEIINQSDQEVNLEGWQIKDANSNSSDDLTLNGTLNSGEIKVFERPKGWLNDSGDEVVTLLYQNQLIDSYSYIGTVEGKSFARVPDGGEWKTNINPSKGITNPQPDISSNSTPQPSDTNNQPNNDTAGSTNTQSFTIANTPAKVKSDESFIIKVNLSLSNNPNQAFYIKGAFKTADSSNYFGLTKVGSIWIKNSESSTSQLLINTDASGNYSGDLEVKADVSDSGFIGQGDYEFKVARYPSSGGSATWSNSVNIHIDHTPSPSSTSTKSSSTTKSTPKPSASFSNSTSNSIYPLKTSMNSLSNLSEDELLNYKIASIAGVSTASPTVASAKILNSQKINWWYLGAGALFLGVGTSFVVLILKRR